MSNAEHVEPAEQSGTMPSPVHVDVLRVQQIGIVIWVVALVVVLAVPSLHRGDHHWWPWCCVAGLVLGLMGYAYVRRGRGNASAA
ncbi:DUF2530 domain-containing protein [Rudaeicoccus suwonensis]|nr:DUF2530 domain-containing protein [Rudaeicoccus suwonensis]